jgi:integrase
LATGKITKRTVDATKPGSRDEYLWDSELAGFGLKVTPAGKRVFLVQYRIGGRRSRTRRVTIGAHGVFTPDQARSEAERILAEVALGRDPAEVATRERTEPTISELASRYLAEHVAHHNKPSTAGEIARILATRVKPALGRLRVTELSRARVKAWHQSMRATPYEANRALAYFSKLMSLAATEWELRSDNPCKGVQRFPEERRERFFDDAEMRRIGEAIAKAQESKSELPGCIACARLLALTGMRLGEVLSLRWSEVDLAAGCIRLPDAKTGPRAVPLGTAALAMLASLERTGDYVVHGPDAGLPLSANTFRHAWNRIRANARIPDARPHDLRHSAATYAAQAGANAFMVRDLLGHKTMSMASRYVGRAIDPMRATADAFCGRVAAALEGKVPAEVASLKHR